MKYFAVLFAFSFILVSCTRNDLRIKSTLPAGYYWKNIKVGGVAYGDINSGVTTSYKTLPDGTSFDITGGDNTTTMGSINIKSGGYKQFTLSMGLSGNNASFELVTDSTGLFAP